MNLRIILLSKEAKQKDEYLVYNSIFKYSRNYQLIYRDRKQNSGCLWGGSTKGSGEMLGGDKCTHYLGGDDGFMGLYAYQNLSNCTLEICAVYCILIMPAKNDSKG